MTCLVDLALLHLYLALSALGMSLADFDDAVNRLKTDLRMESDDLIRSFQ